MGFNGPDKLRTVDILEFYKVFEPYESAEEFYELITALDDLFIRRAREAKALSDARNTKG